MKNFLTKLKIIFVILFRRNWQKTLLASVLNVKLRVIKQFEKDLKISLLIGLVTILLFPIWGIWIEMVTLPIFPDTKSIGIINWIFMLDFQNEGAIFFGKTLSMQNGNLILLITTSV